MLKIFNKCNVDSSDDNTAASCSVKVVTPSYVAEAFRQIAVISAAAFWWFAFEYGSGEALLFSTSIDIIIITILTIIAQMRGLAWQDALLWLLLSRRLHIDAAYGLEALPGIVQTAWILFCIIWCFVKTERGRFLLVLYHAGLTFDAGTTRGFGMGMSIGWEAAPLSGMLLAAALRRLALFAGEIRFPKGTTAVIAGFLYLLALHRSDQSACLTTAVTSTIASAMLFLATAPSKEAAEVTKPTSIDLESLGVLALGGVPLALVALQLAAADASALATLFERRLYAGGLHPNLLALHSLLMLLATFTTSCWLFVPGQIRRPIRAFVGILYVIVLLGTGSRTVMIIGIILCVCAVVSRRNLLNSHSIGLLVSSVVIIPLALMIWKLTKSLSISEVISNERLFIWLSVFKLIRAAPWLGYGVLAYGFLPQNIDPDLGIWIYDWIYPHTHQLILELLIWGGIPFFGLMLFAWIRFWRRNSALTWLLAALAMSISGLFDFVFFTPSMVFLILLVWFSSSGEKANVPKFKHFQTLSCLTLLIGFLALFGVLRGAEAKNQYKNAVRSIAASQSSWKKHIDAAVSAAPLSIELRLQRALMHLSFEDNLEDALAHEIAALKKVWKTYYLLYYIEGRIYELEGDYQRALADYERSLDYEPRDLMGIRNARAAVTSEKSGKSPDIYAWRAVQRGVWGAACILDHPIYGTKFKEMVAEHLSMLRISTVSDMLYTSSVAAALLERDVDISKLKLNNLPMSGTIPPNWLVDAYEAVKLQLASKSIGLPAVLASVSMQLDNFLPSRLHSVCTMAECAHDYVILERALNRLAKVWPYRNKNDEDMQFLWRSAHLAYARKNFSEALFFLQKLDAMDPANPWILEYMGQIFAAAGDEGKAVQAFRAALRCLPAAKLDPMFSNGPREIYNPSGDQWTFAFERAFRRFDEEAAKYHAESWKLFESRLEQQLAELR